MKVTVEKPEVITLLYKQEKTDHDYGTCLWARFYLDLKNYTLAVESDCGNFTYGWVPTPNSETFLQLLARMGEDYLLSKISNKSVIDGDATAEEMQELVKEFSECEHIYLSNWDMEQIADACYHHSDERDLVEAELDTVVSFDLRKALESDTYYLYSAVAKDYPAGAKKIVEVFANYIKPVLKTLEVTP